MPACINTSVHTASWRRQRQTNKTIHSTMRVERLQAIQHSQGWALPLAACWQKTTHQKVCFLASAAGTHVSLSNPLKTLPMIQPSTFTPPLTRLLSGSALDSRTRTMSATCTGPCNLLQLSSESLITARSTHHCFRKIHQTVRTRAHRMSPGPPRAASVCASPQTARLIVSADIMQGPAVRAVNGSP